MRLRRTGKQRKEKAQKKSPCRMCSFAQDDAAKPLIKVGVSEPMRPGRNTENAKVHAVLQEERRRVKKPLLLMMVSLVLKQLKLSQINYANTK